MAKLRKIHEVSWVLSALQFVVMLLLVKKTAGVSSVPYFLLGAGGIQKIPLGGTDTLPLINSTNNVIRGIDFDIREEYMYWSDAASRTINRANLNGKNKTILARSSIRAPDGMAWDWASKKVYWIDSGRKRIEVLDPERNVRKILKNTGSESQPRDMALHPTLGWLFWTDVSETPRIERLSMDGESHSVIVSSDIYWPSSLAIDPYTQTLFWSDTELNRLESSNFDGQQRTILIEDRFIFYPFALTFFEDTLYWGDWVVGFMFRLSVANTSDHDIVRAVMSDPMALTVVSESNQPEAATPCAVANGNCSHLCLISATSLSNYSCACPKHFMLADNRRDCYKKSREEPLEPATTLGSCVSANHTRCCEGDNCQGHPPVCLCSADCRSQHTCCPDINSTCPVPPSLTEFLLVANEDGLVRLDVNGESQSVLVSGESHASAVDYDYSSGWIYWTDVVMGRIRRSQLNGTNISTIASTRILAPEGLAVDWINKILYWSDDRTKKIEILDLVRGYRKSLISTGEDTRPRTVVVDPTTRWFYWSDWGTNALIERASMDGQQRQAIVSSDIVWPNGLTIDIYSQTLYWADAKLDKIEASNVDGSNRRVMTHIGVFHPFSLTHFNSKLFWTDWEVNVILAGSLGTHFHARQLAHLNGNRPMGIKALSFSLQPLVENQCIMNGCSHICLLSSVSEEGYSCMCPESWRLKNGSQTECISLQYTTQGNSSDDSNDEIQISNLKNVTLFPPKSSTTVDERSLESHTSANVILRLGVLPLVLVTVILLLVITVVVMLTILVIRLKNHSKERRKTLLLARRCTAIPNIYTTVHHSTQTQPSEVSESYQTSAIS